MCECNTCRYGREVQEHMKNLSDEQKVFFDDMYSRLMHAETDSAFNAMKRKDIEKENKELSNKVEKMSHYYMKCKKCRALEHLKCSTCLEGENKMIDGLLGKIEHLESGFKHQADNGEPALDVDKVLIHTKELLPRSYKYLCLCKTTCGKHFLGIKRGDEWLIYNNIFNEEAKILPEEYEVQSWIVLD